MLIVVGTAVIAVTYGLGRYAFGLFVPQFQEALQLTGTTVGTIGGLSHAGYALGLLWAPRACRRHDPLRIASRAALTAAMGLAGIAVSVGAATLGASVLVAGVGSGLASPALALAVVRGLEPSHRSPAQTWINSGTSLGLALSGPFVLLTLDWRRIWAGFAALSAVVAVATWRALAPAGGPRTTPVSAPDMPSGEGPQRVRLLVSSVLLGLTSAGYWTFSRQQVLAEGVGEGWSAGFWVTIGLVGLLGGTAGTIVDRLGLMTSLRLWSLVWSGALLAVALPGIPVGLALLSAAAFGAAYMALTGLLIVWAVEVYGGDAASGVRACFLALGIGQAAGSPLAGAVADTWSLTSMFTLSAVASIGLLLNLPAARSRPAPIRRDSVPDRCHGIPRRRCSDS